MVTNNDQIVMSYYYWNLRKPISVALTFVTTTSTTPDCKLSLVTMRELGTSNYKVFGKGLKERYQVGTISFQSTYVFRLNEIHERNGLAGGSHGASVCETQ